MKGKRKSRPAGIRDEATKDATTRKDRAVSLLNLGSKDGKVNGIIVENIPEKLRPLRQWVLWRWQVDEKAKRLTKPPYQTNGRLASTCDPTTWNSFENVVEAYKSGGFDGIGFVLKKGGRLVAFDYDHCRNAMTGEIDDWALHVLHRLYGYTEVSPGGSGLRTIVAADLPVGRRRIEISGGCEGARIEVFDNAGYVTFTGHHLEDTPSDIEVRDLEARSVYAELIGNGKLKAKQDQTPSSGDFDDEELLEKARAAKNGEKFQRLMDGDISGYGSHSDADYALCSILSFWTGGEPVRIDRIFRRSGLLRPKWDEPHSAEKETYGEMTIRKVIAQSKEFYKPGQGKTKNESESKEDETPTQAMLLIELCKENVKEFLRDQFDEPFVLIPVKEHLELHKTSSSRFRLWLTRLFYDAHGRPPARDAFYQTRDWVDGQCFEDRQRELNVRVARHGDRIIYDLSDERWRGIEITADGWRQIPLPPIFYRYKHQRPQVMPVQDGDPRKILDYVRMPEKDRCLFLVALASWFVPDIPHPVLVLHGESGAAKSFVFRILKSLVDPSCVPYLSYSKNLREVVQQLAHHWLAPFDNMSWISDQISDLFCRAVTGEGTSSRKLYTDDEDTIRSFRRCLALNAVSNPVTRGDLLDRSILIELERIPDNERIQEEDLNRRLDADMPSILGGFMDAVSDAMEKVDDVSRRDLPRMADFAVWGQALAPSFGFSARQFMDDYREAIQQKWIDVAGSNLFVSCILELLNDPKKRSGEMEWTGTATDLYNDLMSLDESPGQKKSEGLPKGPTKVSEMLNRMAPALRQIGVTVERLGKDTRSRVKLIRITGSMLDRRNKRS